MPKMGVVPLDETYVNSSSLSPEEYKDLTWGAEQLLRVFLFKPFSVEQRKRIYNLGKIQLIKKSAHAVIEGEPSRGLYLVLSGQLSVYKKDASSSSVSRLASLRPGDSFGELSLFDNAPRSATVAADSPSHLFVLDADRFEEFLEREGDSLKAAFFRNCAVVLSEKFRALNADYLASQQLLWKHALRREK